MASIRRHRDKWQAQIRTVGIKQIAKSFLKKAEAIAWSRIIEAEIYLGKYIDPRAAESVTLSEAIDRYLLSCVKSTGPDKAMLSRLKRLRCDLGALPLSKLSVSKLATYRDQRLEGASPTTVHHELNLLLRILRLANGEWEIRLPQGVPSIRLPKLPCGRNRRLQHGELLMLLDCSNDDEELKRFLLLAIETGARRSELTSLEWKDVDLTGGTLTFRQTKNGTDRTIPLTGTAKSTLESMPKHHSLVFSLSSSQVTRKFSKACSRAQISDLRLHDLRHEAISRFFEAGLNQIEVAAISGHKSITMLHRYTHISTAHLLKKFITSNLTES